MPEAIRERVSILIAARNEEATILTCLQAIDNLAYPPDCLEVLIGNDRSEDGTGSLVDQFICNKPQFRLVDITTNLNQQQGKANVLAQLARQASGQYLFFTDADTAVPPTWISGMLRPFQDPRIGIVTGCTQINGREFWATIQAMEWLVTQYLIKQFADWDIPLTAMGNNMAVRRPVYQQTGGYEKLPFSVVEDYQLFREVLQRGHSFAHLFEPTVLATTQPMPDWRSWMQQRKRWMVGAFQLPWYFAVLLVAQALFLPLLLLLALWQPLLALGLWLARFLWQSVQLVQVARQFRRYDFLPYLLPYDLVMSVNWLLSLLYYWLPTPVTWKNRTFNP
ncbi:hypothetical protein GCM10023189_26170 [Nibrella saemangeumensis]|uniref:Glycosyltransferase, catalytic subunit of cellulose synthase and poly-beta-1,6-N-acetylglucosamine synthase n=1 Tax=Nibrella saemangeumensis TaxID=1084526 RepID=A0ABP8MV26_9BACT